jgi:hypothetical protein
MDSIRPPVGPPRTEQNQRALAALRAAAVRNLPMFADHDKVAESLVRHADGAVVDPTTIEAMQAGIVRNAQNAHGINEDTLAARRMASPVGDYLHNMPGMELGAGDQKNYRALRDSNLLNAALDLPPVKDIGTLREGYPYGEAEHAPSSPSWFSPMTFLAGRDVAEQKNKYDNLDGAVQSWERGEADPQRWGNVIGSNYPQHAWTGNGGSLDNITKNNGGTLWGDLLAWTNRWDEGGNRAMLTPDKPGYVENAPDAGSAGIKKWATGAWQGADEEQKHRTVRGLVGRGSPLLPGNMTPGTPEADAHITALKGLTDATERPSVDEHAAARGEKIGHLTKAFRDNRFVWADPFTLASLGVGGAGALMGKGALKALLAAGGREVLQEGSQPLNYVGVAASLINGPQEVETTPEEFAAKRQAAEAAFKQIPSAISKYRNQ